MVDCPPAGRAIQVACPTGSLQWESGPAGSVPAGPHWRILGVMPVTPGEYELEKNDDGSYKVVNTVSGDVHAKSVPHAVAMHQRQLLYAVGHGWKPANSDHDR